MTLPNQLTVLRIILTPVFMYLFLSGDPVLVQYSVAVFFIAALTDWYDGWLARRFNYITDWGKFMDPLADKILTSAAFFGFVLLGYLELWMVLIIIVRDFIVTLLRAYADYKKVSFYTSKYAKWKTALQMVFLYYLVVMYMFVNITDTYANNKNLIDSLMNPSFIYCTMLFITIMTAHSGFTYIYKNRFFIKNIFKNEA